MVPCGTKACLSVNSNIMCFPKPPTHVRASAGEGVDGIDGAEEDRVGRNESRGVAELEDVEAFFIVEARLPNA